MLDARVPPGGWKEEERRAAEQAEDRMRELLKETRLWRAMNSAMWVAWGIVQAKIPGYTEEDKPSPDNSGTGEAPSSPSGSSSAGTVTEDHVGSGAEDGGSSVGGGGAADEEPGFDYLAYAHERALFFWGDCVQMGLVRLEELPEGLRERVKLVDY